MSSSKDQKKRYLHEKVNPLLERLVTDILITMPDDVPGFMKEWADTKARPYLEKLAKGSKSSPSKKVAEPEHSDEEEDDDEEIAELPTRDQLINNNKNKGMRSSVSAEVYGQFNQKSAFKPKVIPKSQEQRERIRKRLSQAFMFSALDDKEQDIVIDAMQEKTFKTGDVIIKQGDNGDDLYVVDHGKLECTKLFAGKSEPTFLKNYEPGESFGELALLYNAPRAATIKAVEQSTLFALDRETFNHIVKDAAVKKREEYENFLSGLELLSDMDAYERSKIADAAKRVKFAAGEYVVKEGERGDVFFFVEEGEAVATKTINSDEPPKEVFTYKPGGYFGELALLKDIPRQASVVAKTDLKLVALDRNSFKRLIGPLEKILQRNFTNYEKFLA